MLVKVGEGKVVDVPVEIVIETGENTVFVFETVIIESLLELKVNKNFHKLIRFK